MSTHVDIVVQFGFEMWSEPDLKLSARWLPGQLGAIYRTWDTPGLIRINPHELIRTN